MRLRNIRGSREVIAESPYVIHEEESRAGTWKEIFGNDHPVCIEIGMGKGKFIMETARRNPQNNYVGIEKYSSVLLRALEKMDQEEQPLKNLYLCGWTRSTLQRCLPRESVRDLSELLGSLAKRPTREAEADQSGIPAEIRSNIDPGGKSRIQDRQPPAF